MLNDLKAQAAYEADEMERLKAEGREKSATYRQFFGNRLFYKQMLDAYKKYGLMDEPIGLGSEKRMVEL